MAIGTAILRLLTGVILATSMAMSAASERAAAQTGTNIVQNREKPDLLLNVQGGQPLATPAARGETTAHWLIERTGEGDFVRLRNVGTGFLLHAEGGRLQAGTAQSDWLSAQWTLEYVANIPDARIKNRASGGYLHNQDGPLVIGPAPAQWGSSFWKLTPVGARVETVIPPPPSGRCNGKWVWSKGKHVCVRNCPPGTHPVGSLCMKNCPPGFYPKGNMCVKGCPPGYHLVGKTCVKNKVCPQGQHLSKGHCCPAGKNWNQVQKKCV